MEIELFSGLDQEDGFPAGVSLLAADVRSVLVRTAEVRHARHRDFSTALANLATKRALLPEDQRIGIICIGGPVAVAPSLAFAQQALDRGPRFVNPIGFPPTLISDVPTQLAALIGAHQFALTVGWNRLAFLEAIKVADLYRRLGLAELVVVVAAMSGAGLGPITAGTCLERSVLDISLAARVGPVAGTGRLVEVVELDAPGLAPDIILDWQLQEVSGHGSLLTRHEALTASVAVLMSEIAMSGAATSVRLSDGGLKASLLIRPR
ncbi:MULTISPECIES: hypothetical protein [unclassified Mesorhizobium]|uniref:hypothetical protein n=1 Tax=unclassified Mesorhizobium TaxID=325217 RepID=UPI0010932AE6|nr:MULTISPECIES: hypothetical protein [unclassified Mesorhizobium]TGQ28191.1 hypothetical protein EN857_31810 [Mesorhizobium sp. M4B.F.Ca.ET.214.01.1.1]TGQ55371.1 hypothetical protein EN854_31430 [Mesorhizobium sp. M4B.F.Ca.ET.211.01.1.1]TGU28725.1 hypothetical protein EN793_31655 [Mesorhizobium sp. M4B.F.Ca.ET.150.01.1.1]TIX16346.1 MAG: hypothetical protein E5V46_02965 [Mesorhizobium sp.]